ncbi:hypothetical protein LCGC14_1881480 [marine sediment metagenome]|uniref:Uncharacterized protein n=1 Tax=marine sediment metagenome TaxID=412755 RepID=A0A0F9J0L5_9ZZZZ
MATELKGRFAQYYSGDKEAGIIERQSRISLNAVKVNWGMDIARIVLTQKTFSLGKYWFELELLPGEKNGEETARERKTNELCKALYKDLSQSYSSLTLAAVRSDVEKLIAGGEPTGIIQMWAQPFLVQLGLLKEE